MNGGHVTRMLLRRAALTGAIVSTLSLIPGAGGLAHAAPSITDPGGDTTDDNDRRLDAPRADITAADAARVGGNFVFRYTVADAVNPLSDPNWGSDDTWTDFMLDVDGNGQTDFEVEYGVDDGALYVEVRKEDGSDDPPLVCEGTAGFEGGYYVATVPGACIGNPAGLGYRVETVYDTTPAGEDGSPIAYDNAPDDGYAGPV